MAPAGDDEAQQRALRASVERIRAELQRSGLQMLATDLLLAVLIGIEVAPVPALLWFAGMQMLQLQRRRAAE